MTGVPLQDSELGVYAGQRVRFCWIFYPTFHVTNNSREGRAHQHNNRMNRSSTTTTKTEHVLWARAAASERTGRTPIACLAVRACPSRHRTPRLCFSFSPHLRSFISNPRHYRHFSPDGQHSPLVAPKPYADHPARRPSSPARPASHRLHFQRYIARATPSRSPVES